METNMRKQYILTTDQLSDADERVITLLGEIGVFSFRNIKQKHKNQVQNLGIMEPASIGIAAGLAQEGFIPFFHTIAPFIVERAYEQLKVDFGYQCLCGNFVSVGASYDDGGLGSTHYCPADVPALMHIPNMQIVVPGTAKETDQLICSSYDNGYPTYYRLSTACNRESYYEGFGKAVVIKKGIKATVVAVGPLLEPVLEAVRDLDVTVLYYTTVTPFDKECLCENCASRKVLLCEPYYYGALTTEIMTALQGAVMMDFVGVDHKFITTYGSKEQIDKDQGISPCEIAAKLRVLLDRSL